MAGSCPSCQYFQAAVRPQLFRLSTRSGPGELAAAKSFEDLQRERAINEQRLVEQGDPFFVEPQFFNWCERFTLSETNAKRIADAVAEGDEDVADDWRAKGYEFAIDYANGDVRRVFVLCARQNPDGKCAGHVRKARR